jgi:hypothetical protein
MICKNGMWITGDKLCSKFGSEEKKLARLRCGGLLLYEMVCRVSNSKNRKWPVYNLGFYQVKEEGVHADDFGVPLSSFIELCESLEHFVNGEDSLSEKTVCIFKNYIGVDNLPPIHSDSRISQEFSSFVEQLWSWGLIIFAHDVIIGKNAKEEMVCHDMPHNRGKDETGVERATGNDSYIVTTRQNESISRCQGVNHTTLNIALITQPHYAFENWNIVDGRPVSKDCAGASLKASATSCSKCVIEYKNITHSRHPVLFDDVSSDNGRYTLSRSEIERELQRLWKLSLNESVFMDRDDVKYLCRLFVFRADKGACLLTDHMFLCLCENAGFSYLLSKPHSVSSNMSLNGGTDERCELFFIKHRKKDATCCNSCQSNQRNAKKRQRSRGTDLGRRFEIGSKVNFSHYSPDGPVKYMQVQGGKIRELNQQLLKAAAKKITAAETEEVPNAVEGSMLVDELFQHAASNKKALRSELLNCLVQSKHSEMRADTSTVSGLHESDCEAFVSTILNEIDNFVYKANNKEKIANSVQLFS